jgi:hypothetical protein
MTKDKRRTLEEIKEKADEAEAAYRKRRAELMTPQEAEYIWEEMILPKLQDVKPMMDACDSERAEKSAILLLIRELTQEYIRQRESRRDRGLPPLVPDDIDKPRDQEGATKKGQS